MRLQFTKDGITKLIPRDESVACLKRIHADSKMVVEAMKGGIPVMADGGEYILIEEHTYETVLLSVCCRKSVSNSCDSQDTCALHFVCDNCKGSCEATEVCVDCHGTEVVNTMEPVYAGEPHMAPVGTERCPTCKQ